MTTKVKHFISFKAQADATHLRKEKYLGREHLVVPVVALVQGVIQGINAPEPELALASEFAKVPDSWNGRPIMMNHPARDGVPVSANSPDLLEAFQFGFMFKSQRTDDDKLIAEAWLDLERVDTLGGEIADTVERLQAGETVEVSTGLYTTNIDQHGEYDGKKYSSVWREVIPDHLAFLSAGSVGACSVSDGCGAPRANSTSDNPTPQVVPAKSWSELHTALRAAEKAKLAAEGKESDCECHKIKPGEKKLAKSELARLQRLVANSYPDSMVDRDVRQILDAAIKEQYGEGYWCSLVVFTAVDAVYVCYDMMSWDSYMYSVPYMIDDNTKVTFTGEPVPVMLLTKIAPVQESTQQGTTTMAQNSATTIPNSAAGTPSQAAPPAAPVTTPVANAVPVAPAAEPTPVAQPTAAATPRVLTAQEYIEQAPPGVREMLEEGMRAQTNKKNELITKIKACGRCAWSDAELAVMSIPSLEKLAKLAEVPSHAGMAPAGATFGSNGARITDNIDDGPVPAPILVFPRKDPAAA